MSKIEKITIPDEDVPNWLKALKEGGLSEEEIDSFLERKNKGYFEAKHPNYIEDELNKIKEEYFRKYHKVLTKEEEEYFRKGIESRLKED